MSRAGRKIASEFELWLFRGSRYLIFGSFIVYAVIGLAFDNWSFAFLLSALGVVPLLAGTLYAAKRHWHEVESTRPEGLRFARATLRKHAYYSWLFAAASAVCIAVIPLNFWASLYVGAVVVGTLSCFGIAVFERPRTDPDE